MPLYKVSLQQGATTRSATYEASTSENLKIFLEDVTTMKVKSIYKIEYEDISDVKPVDDFNYNRMVKAFVRNIGSYSCQVILHNVKLTRSKDEVVAKIKEFLRINGTAVDSVTSYLVKAR